MYYTIYETTCLTSGWIYIGKHQTKDLDDGYLGSGKLIQEAIIYYGKENFSKEILHIFDTEEEMNQKEAELVTEDFCAQSNNFNLCPGGKGGWGYVNQNLLNGDLNSRDPKIMAKDRMKGFNTAKPKMRASLRKRHKEGKFKYGISFKGKSHTEETKRKMSEKAKEIFSDPSRNSQFGTMWITNGTENKKIKKTDSIPEGYRKGRFSGKLLG